MELTAVKECTRNEETSKLFFSNIILANKTRRLNEENESLRARLAQLESQSPSLASEARRKRKRRMKEEIARAYPCKLSECGKAYGWSKKLRELAQPAHASEAPRAVGPRALGLLYRGT